MGRWGGGGVLVSPFVEVSGSQGYKIGFVLNRLDIFPL